MTEEEYRNLPTRRKIALHKKQVSILKVVGDKQIKLLNEHRKSPSEKQIGFDYLFRTLKYTWRCTKFSVSLGSGNNKIFAVYPIRTICENVFKLEYYANSNQYTQNRICAVEMVRVVKKIYNEIGGEKLREQYNTGVEEFKEYLDEMPDPDSPKQIPNPFPSFETMITKSKLPSANTFYVHYRMLSEAGHSSLLSQYVNEDEEDQYRRLLFYLAILLEWLLIVTDNHIKGVTKAETQTAIKEARAVLNIK